MTRQDSMSSARDDDTGEPPGMVVGRRREGANEFVLARSLAHESDMSLEWDRRAHFRMSLSRTFATLAILVGALILIVFSASR